MKTVLILGGSGFVGSHLAATLHRQGWRVVVVSRSPEKSRQALGDAYEYIASPEQWQGEVDWVVNLSGAVIAGPKWSETRKAELRESRIGTTRRLREWLLGRQQKPRLVLSASAVGYYGIDEQRQWPLVDEQSPPQPIFMSQLCQEWEAEARALAGQTGIAVGIMRLGVVLGTDGGALPPMLKPIRLNVAGRIGDGKQPLPWIHIDDAVAAMLHMWQQPPTGWQAFNFTAPQQVSQGEFAAAAARVLRRRPLFAVPAWVMRGVLGEQADLILNGQRVIPQALLAHGFSFRYPELLPALQHLLAHKA